MNKHTNKILIILFILFSITASAFASGRTNKNELFRVNKGEYTKTSQIKISKLSKATVYKSVDGDTIKIEFENPPEGVDKQETIRMIGVDTPETVHPKKPVQFFGKEASNYTKSTLLNKTVYIACDFNLRDKYGRLLAYIFTENGECFNLNLILNGYGYAYVSYPFQFMDEFVEAQRTAQNNKAGLWK